ncbi:putative mrna decapping complex subunit 2 [Erysiphe neolycopersici]|uniref:Putative mrna decapping complex subunit 2 n=1 Tax=Erysiphe neolycopersici TaxID=212602 RepID=A0A420HZ56_9PEZI|nr:putative mrna decapping complex subunit 2 [Erysiphe neolycopersici]
MERKMQLQDWLDDLCVRFLMNGPKEDLETAERICFRVEEAQWYYEDFIRPQDPTLPSMTLKCFCDEIFAHCPLLLPFSQDHRMKAFDAFLSYKKRVPVRGAIMLNQNMDKLVLVKGWKKGANWSFPRGKINKDEDDLDCAIREVYEETGFDLGEAGFVPADRQVKSIELNMHEQQIRLFVFRGIPMNTHFEPRTRKEISAIDWWQLSDLPAFRKGKTQVQQPVYKATNFYMVAPFLAPVRRWIAEQKKQDASCALDGTYQSGRVSWPDEVTSEEDQVADSDIKVDSREEGQFTSNTISSFREHNLYNEVESANFTQDLSTKDAGSALLAILNSKANNQRQKNLLNTSPSHKTLQNNLSQIPHHYQIPNASLFTSMLPSPKFPINEQSEDPIPYHQQLIKNQYERVIDAQKHVQSPTYNSIVAPHPHQHLIHPQPLPPSVQRTVFAQSPMPASPQVSKDMFLNLTPKMHHIPSTDTTIIPGNEKYSSPKLTSHTMSLLNSFKSHNHSLPLEANIKPNSEVGMSSGSSKDPEFNYNQEIYRSSNFIPPQRQIGKPSTFHGLKKDLISQISAPDRHTQLRSGTLISDIPTIRKDTQTISPSDKGFLLGYLDAVVAKGANI